jgi:hypothetical protein
MKEKPPAEKKKPETSNKTSEARPSPRIENRRSGKNSHRFAPVAWVRPRLVLPAPCAAASELANRTAEHLVDKTMPVEEQQRRKRALIKGPKEFREIREDLPKSKT